MSGKPQPLHPHRASPKGDIYVSDGAAMRGAWAFAQRAAQVVGEPGKGPGEFNIVHNIATDPDGWVMSPTAKATASRCSTATAS
jgi:hypothetical protein